MPLDESHVGYAEKHGRYIDSGPPLHPTREKAGNALRRKAQQLHNKAIVLEALAQIADGSLPEIEEAIWDAAHNLYRS